MCKAKEENIVGTQIGILDILYECDFKHNDGHKMYHVKCIECGWESNQRKSDIKRVGNKCVHTRVDGSYISFKKTWENKRLKRIFDKMKQRCYNEKNKDYKWYGAKGIKIYNEWMSNPKLFEKWALENGYNDSLSIDRIDENKDYSPNNCRWITDVQNAKYKSTTSLINVNDETHTGKDWSKILGFSENVINRYVKKYGLENTIEFIKRYIENPNLKPNNRNQSIYSLYMNQI